MWASGCVGDSERVPVPSDDPGCAVDERVIASGGKPTGSFADDIGMTGSLQNGSHLRRNFLFRREQRPEPSMRTMYWR